MKDRPRHPIGPNFGSRARAPGRKWNKAGSPARLLTRAQVNRWNTYLVRDGSFTPWTKVAESVYGSELQWRIVVRIENGDFDELDGWSKKFSLVDCPQICLEYGVPLLGLFAPPQLRILYLLPVIEERNKQ